MAERFEQAESDADPHLRAALKRLHGGHVAASDLRNRITSLMQAPPVPHEDDVATRPAVAGRIESAPRAAPGTRWPRLIAIAAAVVLVVGATAIFLNRRGQEENQRNAYYVQRNLTVLKAMVATAATVPTSESPADRVADVSNARSVQAELSKRLSRQVPTPDLSADGWQLKDAAAIAFRSDPAARCDFTKAGHRVTLISVPAKVFNNPDEDDTYDATIDGHAISGYVARDGVHCVVGDSGVPLSEITALRKHVQSL
jgi:anti-sigma factor RsiW